MKATSVKQILKAIGNEHLDLVRGPGYWYFVYDDRGAFATHCVMVMRLGQLSVEQWAREGREFCREMEEG